MPTPQDEQYQRQEQMYENERKMDKFIEDLPLLSEPVESEEEPVPKCYFTKND